MYKKILWEIIMSKSFKIISVVLIVLFVVVIPSCGTYNNMVDKQEAVESQWAQVENQYQRRMDLIPNLVSTVKGYAAHESETFQAITDARSKVGSIQVTKEILDDPEALKKYQEAQSQLSGALSRLLAVSENYPELKANENFLSLQDQLEGTENRISVERNRFNESVKDYNVTIRRFPQNIFAKMFGFREKAYFTASEGASVAPTVKF